MSNPEPLVWKRLEGSESVRGWIFDLDGTLLDIAPRPDAVQVPNTLLQTLTGLMRRFGGQVAIVSGRSLPDLMRLLPIPSLTLVGNHGAEARWREQRIEFAAEGVELQVLDRIRPQLQRLPKKFPGLQVEDKGWTVSVHVRHVAAPLLDQVEETLRQLIAEGELYLRPAQACWEIGSRQGATKGDAVRWLRRQWRNPEPLAIFGDDVTDEDAFNAKGPRDVTVIVGSRRPTCAQYYLQTPTDLRLGLQSLVSKFPSP